MSMLLRPDNGQPAEYITYSRGYVCLRTTCITPAVRWFSHEQMLIANPMFEPAKQPNDSGLDYCSPQPCRAIVVYVAPKPLVVKMPADLMGHIREALYCELKAA